MLDSQTMTENENIPLSLDIYPDYGGTYAWDQDGECISITECWPDIPELADLHDKLGAWAETYERTQSGEQQFIELYDRNDIEGYYARGKVLATELARLLALKRVPVSFYGELILCIGSQSA
jgi:hypothetical protein